MATEIFSSYIPNHYRCNHENLKKPHQKNRCAAEQNDLLITQATEISLYISFQYLDMLSDYTDNKPEINYLHLTNNNNNTVLTECSTAVSDKLVHFWNVISCKL